MAYSDYGGFAYRNGERIIGRSDCAICDDGFMASPGIWPGWVKIAKAVKGGQDLEKARQAIATCEMFHVLLGDGPITIGMYKQSHISVWRQKTAEPLSSHGISSAFMSDYAEGNYLRVDDCCDKGPYTFYFEGDCLTLIYEQTDNYYSFVEWKQNDGVVWHGFSGYGVGAGFEDCQYGYSTQDCEDRLFELFLFSREERS